MEQRYQSFSEFYPFYLSQHQHPVCRRLHFIGSVLILIVLGYILYSQHFIWLISLPVIGYGFAWIGHFVFEKNRPATFTYPLWSEGPVDLSRMNFVQLTRLFRKA